MDASKEAWEVPLPSGRWNTDTGRRSRVSGCLDRYIEHGTQAQLYKECGYDADSIVAKAVSMCEARGAASADTGMRIA